MTKNQLQINFKNKLVLADGYDELVKNVRNELTDLENYVKEAIVKRHWNVGKFIDNHILKSKQRAEYGAFVIENLANDVGKDKSVLFRALQFYRSYPIVAARRQLDWSLYKALITVKDSKKRDEFEKIALKQSLSSRQLKEKISLDRLKTETIEPSKPVVVSSPKKLTVNRAKLFTYQILEPAFIHPVDERLVIDLGFTFIIHAPAKGIRLKALQIVEAIKNGNDYSLIHSQSTPKNLFTYTALVERIVDADTILLNIDLGFNAFARQKIRLRGIDSPELATKEGKEAKKYVESKLKEVNFVIVKTYKSDKYDRYLADVFYLKDENDPVTVLEKGQFLNQELLDLGLAVPMK